MRAPPTIPGASTAGRRLQRRQICTSMREAVPGGAVGAVLAWEAEGAPDPTPFRVDRPVTVRTEIVNGYERSSAVFHLVMRCFT